MTERARREYADVLRPRYQRADKQERGRILDEASPFIPLKSAKALGLTMPPALLLRAEGTLQ